LICDVRNGEGRVERQAIPRPTLPAPSDAALALFVLARIFCVAGLAAAGLLAWHGRKLAALATLLGSGLCGAAAPAAGLPPDAEAERIFLAIHEQAMVREDASLRRVKPLETHVERSIGGWGPEFRVRHRWESYGSVSHSGHAHAGMQEREASYRVRWQDGAWRLLSDG